LILFRRITDMFASEAAEIPMPYYRIRPLYGTRPVPLIGA
jgi:hypothetical protein